jgi:hypothetical protein
MLMSIALPKSSVHTTQVYYNMHMFDYCMMQYKYLSEICDLLNVKLSLSGDKKLSTYALSVYWSHSVRLDLMKNYPQYCFQHPCMKLLEVFEEKYMDEAPKHLENTFYDTKNAFNAITDKEKWKSMYFQGQIT